VIAGPVVIDASVVVEYLVALRFTEQARWLFARLLDTESVIELWAPDLIFPEIASGLRKLVSRRVIEARAGARAIDQLTRLPISAASSSGLMREVWRARGSFTVYDACYVILARRLGAPFVTADARLARALTGRPVRARLLNEIEI
jgi:predicted nucleic acid-binding protein